MQPEEVSIMMPAYNAETYIGQAIASVLSQTFSNWRLIIVNDGSTDRTGEIISGFFDPRITVINQANGGEAAARNTALLHVNGKYLAFLDADDIYLPRHLEVTLEYMNNHPNMGGVYTDGYYIDQEGAKLKTLSTRRRAPFQGDIFEEVIRSSDVFGTPLCVVLRSEPIIRHHLLFDTGITIGPDWDFLTQFCETEAFGYIDQATCLYRVHPTNISLRTGSQRRILSLARCREKAIQMRRFPDCSVEVKNFVFYDLLVNLLRGSPEMQERAFELPEFNSLPNFEQARLLRLVASRAIVDCAPKHLIKKWLQNAQQRNPGDRLGQLLLILYTVQPFFCRMALKTFRADHLQPASLTPFTDLFEVKSEETGRSINS